MRGKVHRTRQQGRPARHGRGTVYTLDNPEKVLPFAGQKVRITGTLRKNEITVATIENVF